MIDLDSASGGMDAQLHMASIDFVQACRNPDLTFDMMRDQIAELAVTAQRVHYDPAAAIANAALSFAGSVPWERYLAARIEGAWTPDMFVLAIGLARVRAGYESVQDGDGEEAANQVTVISTALAHLVNGDSPAAFATVEAAVAVGEPYACKCGGTHSAMDAEQLIVLVAGLIAETRLLLGLPVEYLTAEGEEA